MVPPQSDGRLEASGTRRHETGGVLKIRAISGLHVSISHTFIGAAHQPSSLLRPQTLEGHNVCCCLALSAAPTLPKAFCAVTHLYQ